MSTDVRASGLGIGIGLRSAHYRDFLDRRPAVDWLEVHSENYFSEGNWDAHVLDLLRRDYPISLHGVGLAIGSAEGFFSAHLERIAALVRRIEPALISEHLCWGAIGGRHLNDLLPLMLSREAIALVSERVDRMQQRLGRQVLLENVSTYLRFRDDVLGEAAFLTAVTERTGCGVLLDVNNLFVNQCNHGEDARQAMLAVPAHAVREVHLAGHLVTPDAVIDDHGSRVAAPVWDLYRDALRRFGPVSTLIEWDTDLPQLDVLLDEVRIARELCAGRPRVADNPLEAQPVSAPRSDQAPVLLAGTSPAPAPAPPPMPAPAPLTGRAPEPVKAAAPVSEPAYPQEHAAPAPDAVRPAQSLAASQQAFADALLDGARETTLLPWFKSAPAQTIERLGLYRGNLVSTWEKALQAAYPVIDLMVGRAFFAGLARAFGKKNPSMSGDLNEFGAAFAGFLRSFPPVGDFPYLPELAALEWQIHRAFHAPEATAIEAADVARLTPERLDASRFNLHPSTVLISTSMAVVSLWLAHQEAEVTLEGLQLEQPEWALLSRPQWQPQLVKISMPEFVALRAIQGGATLGEALDAALALDEDFDFAGALARWLGERILGHAAAAAR